MNNSIQYSLTQSSIGHRIFIYPLNTLVANPAFEVFGVYDIHHTIGDADKRTVYFVLIPQVHIVIKVADFHIRTIAPLIRILMEK